VVKILLRRDDVDPDRTENRGRTPLWSAARGGHTGVVALLKSRGPPAWLEAFVMLTFILVLCLWVLTAHLLISPPL